MQGIKKMIAVAAVAFNIMIASPIISSATVISIGEPWGEFGFDGLGDTTICTSCDASSGNNSFPLGASPWTFSGPGSLIVQDAFFRGDRFEVFDGINSLGLTSIPVIDDPDFGPGCGSDPVTCFSDPGSSHRIFALGDGDHSLSIEVVQAPFGSGAAYLCIDSGQSNCGVNISADHEVPEPDSIFLLGLSLAAVYCWAMRRRISECYVRIRSKFPRR